MRWNQGRATVETLIADGELQRVPPSREHADQLLVQARPLCRSSLRGVRSVVTVRMPQATRKGLP